MITQPNLSIVDTGLLNSLIARFDTAISLMHKPTGSTLELDDIVSHDQAASILKIRPSSLYQLNWKRQGPPFFRRGKRNFYSKKALEVWIKDNQVDQNNQVIS